MEPIQAEPTAHTAGDEDILTLNRVATVARLLGGATHEVNNALQVISGTVELLESWPDLPDPMKRALERLREQSNRAGAVIASVGRFARQRPDARARVNLRELVADAVQLRTFAVRRARLSIALSDSATRSVVVDGSAVELQQAVLNLIINAEQALAGSRGKIEVAVFEEDQWAAVRVRDDGPGVAKELAEKIFEPFMTTRPRLEASGLGLAAARLIATAHGGTLVLEDTPAGASFVLRIPRAATARDAKVT